MTTQQALVPFLALKTEIAPQLVRVPPSAVERALRRAFDELCRASTVWRYFCPPLDVKASEPTYVVPVPPEGRLWRVMEAEYKAPTATQGKPLHVRSEDEMRRAFVGTDYHNRFAWFQGGTDWKAATGEPHSVLHTDNAESARLVPIPTEASAQGLAFYIAARPSREAERLPEWLAERYYEALTAGAAARLFAMRDEAWSDSTAAEEEGERFKAKLAEVQADVILSHGRGALEVVPRNPLNQ